MLVEEEDKLVEGAMGQEEGDVEAVEDVDSDAEDLGERKPKVGRRPMRPTKQEIEEHFPNHAHYRSWCADCRAGRSISRQHRRKDAAEEPLGPTIN